MSRKRLSSILNGHAATSPEMAIRLSKAFGTSAESWLNQQALYERWVTQRALGKIKVTRLSAA